MADGVAGVAGILSAAFASGRPVDDDTTAEAARAIGTEEDAYRVQAEVARAVGRMAGWKVGRASPTAAPICAPLFAGRLHGSGETLARDAFRLWRIEAELAFRLDRDLPPVDRQRGREEVLDAVREVVAVFEIVDSRYGAWPDVPPLLQLADLQSHGAMVLGDATRLRDGFAFETVRASLEIDGKGVVQERANPAGDVVELLVWLANRRLPDGRSPRAGDLVTTGSFTGVTPLAPGGEAVARFGEFGTVKVRRGTE